MKPEQLVEILDNIEAICDDHIKFAETKKLLNTKQAESSYENATRIRALIEFCTKEEIEELLENKITLNVLAKYYPDFIYNNIQFLNIKLNELENPYKEIFQLFKKQCNESNKRKAFEIIRKLKQEKLIYYILFCIYSSNHNGITEALTKEATNTYLKYHALNILVEQLHTASIKKILSRINIDEVRKIKNLLATIPGRLLDNSLDQVIEEKLASIEEDKDIALRYRLGVQKRSQNFTIDTLTRELSQHWSKPYAELNQAIVNHASPGLFSFILLQAISQSRMQWAHQLCIARLDLSPNSISFISELGHVLSQGNRLVLAASIFARSLKIRFQAKHYTLWAHMLANIGQWSQYEEYLRRTLEYSNFLGAKKPIFAINETFVVDAAPFLTLQEKISVYKLIWTSKIYVPKNERRKWNSTRTIAMISGDFRNHAMNTALDKLIHSAKATGANVVLFSNTPLEKEDEKTEEYRNSCELININGLPLKEAAEIIRSYKPRIAFDLSQHTAHNALAVFKLGLAPIHLTTCIPQGFSTGLPDFDYILVDEYGFANIRDDEIIEKQIPIQNIFNGKPIVNLNWDKTNNNESCIIGVFARAIRYSPLFLKALAEIAIQSGATIKFSHHQLDGADTQKYLIDTMANFGVNTQQIIIDHSSFHQGIKDVSFAVDTFPSNSPTVATDLIMAGMPVLALLGETPMQRIIGSIMLPLGLGYFICESIDELKDKAIKLAKNEIQVELNLNQIRTITDQLVETAKAQITKKLLEILDES